MAEKKPETAPNSKTKKVTRTVKTKATSEITGFVDFIRSQGVIGLAVGLVIGTQVKALVDQMLLSFIDPLLGLVVGGGKGLSGKTFYLHFSGRSATFAWGAFIYALIDFVVIASVIYFTFKWLRLEKLDKKKDK